MSDRNRQRQHKKCEQNEQECKITLKLLEEHAKTCLGCEECEAFRRNAERMSIDTPNSEAGESSWSMTSNDICISFPEELRMNTSFSPTHSLQDLEAASFPQLARPLPLTKHQQETGNMKSIAAARHFVGLRRHNEYIVSQYCLPLPSRYPQSRPAVTCFQRESGHSNKKVSMHIMEEAAKRYCINPYNSTTHNRWNQSQSNQSHGEPRKRQISRSANISNQHLLQRRSAHK